MYFPWSYCSHKVFVRSHWSCVVDTCCTSMCLDVFLYAVDGRIPAPGKIKHIVNNGIIFDYINCRLAKDEVLTCIDLFFFFSTRSLLTSDSCSMLFVGMWGPPRMLPHHHEGFASPKCLLTLLPRLWQTQMLTTNEVASKGRMHWWDCGVGL